MALVNNLKKKKIDVIYDRIRANLAGDECGACDEQYRDLNFSLFCSRFYVEAKDQGSPRSRSAISTVQISVLDRNDNDPIMSQRTYDIVVSESEPLGSEILKVVATDPDEDSEIRYEIVGGNVANAFSISSRQGIGIITIAQPLDYNKEKFYR